MATASQLQSALKVKTTTVVAAVVTIAGADDDAANSIESACPKLNGPLLDAANRVCGHFKKHQWKSETWWWSGYMRETCTVQSLQCPDKGRHDDRDQSGAKTVCIDAKLIAKCAVWLVKSEAEKELFATVTLMAIVFSILPNKWTIQTRTLLMKIVYAMMLVSSQSLTKTGWWHGVSTMLGCSMSNLSGQARSFIQLMDPPPPPPPPPPSVSVTLIQKACRKVKCSKASGPYGIVAEMLLVR